MSSDHGFDLTTTAAAVAAAREAPAPTESSSGSSSNSSSTQLWPSWDTNGSLMTEMITAAGPASHISTSSVGVVAHGFQVFGSLQQQTGACSRRAGLDKCSGCLQQQQPCFEAVSDMP